MALPRAELGSVSFSSSCRLSQAFHAAQRVDHEVSVPPLIVPEGQLHIEGLLDMDQPAEVVVLEFVRPRTILRRLQEPLGVVIPREGLDDLVFRGIAIVPDFFN
jgi:hypothetical protein